MKMAQIQSLPRKRCPICGMGLKHPCGQMEKQRLWRQHRRKHYAWGREDANDG